MSTAPLAPLPGTTGCQTAPSAALLRLLVSLLGKTSPPPRARATSRFPRGLPARLPADSSEACSGAERGSSETGGTTKPMWKVLLVNCVSTGSAVSGVVPRQQVGEGMWQLRQGCIGNASCNSTLAAPGYRDLVPLASSHPSEDAEHLWGSGKSSSGSTSHPSLRGDQVPGSCTMLNSGSQGEANKLGPECFLGGSLTP